MLEKFGFAEVSPPPVAVIGRGESACHHGEILQGRFFDRGGCLVRALVTLPRADLRCQAEFQVCREHKKVEVSPSFKVKARRAAELTLQELCSDPVGGKLFVHSMVPVGLGCGSSTSDVVAAIKATAAALEKRLSSKVVARLAVAAESASDPLMYSGRTVLFAHRLGYVLEDLGPALPPIKLVSFDSSQNGEGVSTDQFPPAEYSWEHLEKFHPLLGLLRWALAERSVEALGRVATKSARINQEYLPKPKFDALEKVRERTGAAGIQVAHSGTAIGFLFDALNPEVEERAEMCMAHVRELGFADVDALETGELE